ncbi:hypothetical protein C8A01DRAFT_34137 [Parachaetomium inaequale]|uniref:Uncharacterized protein n=1 Tax=Parachaetomium inaequale TaxID=2588326 RepID=A0AAN6STW8_9PEZI|nr:hypothetical protein C8A01DRAFT_34137 [Parachaetomium inaequale]
MLLPPPIPITTTTGLSCYIIAPNASSYTPRNYADSPNICRNCAPTSTCRILFYRRSSSSVACRMTSANPDTFVLLLLPPPPPPSRNTESNIQNPYHSRLTRWNPIRYASVLNNNSSIDRL